MSGPGALAWGDDGDTIERAGIDTSNVGKQLNTSPPKEPTNCLICDITGIEIPAVAHSLVDSEKEGEPSIFTIATCRLHTARWKHTPVRRLYDGETQRG